MMRPECITYRRLNESPAKWFERACNGDLFPKRPRSASSFPDPSPWPRTDERPSTTSSPLNKEQTARREGLSKWSTAHLGWVELMQERTSGSVRSAVLRLRLQCIVFGFVRNTCCLAMQWPEQHPRPGSCQSTLPCGIALNLKPAVSRCGGTDTDSAHSLPHHLSPVSRGRREPG